ncbi:MAG: hypothetical protein ACYTFG_00780 [Planctomycetota bacterium]|jgi:hypothetical protein
MTDTKKPGVLILGLLLAILSLTSGCSSGPDKELAFGMSRDYANQAVMDARLRLVIHGHVKRGRIEKAKALLETRIEGDVLIMNELAKKLPEVWEKHPEVLAEVVKVKGESEKALEDRGKAPEKEGK